jgi:hypothetical protein
MSIGNSPSMKIKLTEGTTNIQFEHRKTRYLLQASPELYMPTISEVATEHAKPGFIYGRVSLLVLAGRPFRIKREYRVSEDFDRETRYQEALRLGFEVRQDSVSAACLLIRAGLAQLVTKEPK